MSTKAFVVWIATLLGSGDPSRARVADPPAAGLDLRVREWHADRVPTSYQLTFTVTFERP